MIIKREKLDFIGNQRIFFISTVCIIILYDDGNASAAVDLFVKFFK